MNTRFLLKAAAIFCSLVVTFGLYADKNPMRIAVAGGSLTEILFFIGAQDLIVATDTTSNFPLEASGYPSIGYVRNLSAEGLMSLSPSLILGEDDMGPPAIFDQLSNLDVEIVRMEKATNAKSIIDKVIQVGSVVGMQSQAASFVENKLQPLSRQLASEIKKIKSKPRVVILLSVNAGAPIAAGSNTAGQYLLEMAGAKNVIDFEGWRPISTEALIDLQPDYIVLTNRTISTAGGIEKVKLLPVMVHLDAAQAGRVIIMDGMYLLGFGPRTIQAALEVAAIWHPEIESDAHLPFERIAKGG